MNSNHITTIPLTDELLVKLVKLRVGIYFDQKAGVARISQGYWERADDVMKLGITAMIAPDQLPQAIEQVEAKRQEVASE